MKEVYKGYDIEVVQDDSYCENPNEWNDAIQLVSFHRDFWIESDHMSKDTLIAYAEGDKKALKDYHVFMIEAYIHGGVHLSLSNEGGYPDRQWDVSQVGAIIVSKKETRYTKEARAIALSTLKTWNDINSGNVYGFTVSKNGDVLDRCYGFIGDSDYCLQEARDIADCLYKEEVKKRIAKCKGFIKNHVPLIYRSV